MRLPPHLLTKLTLAGAVGAVGVIVALHPMQHTECKPAVDEPEPTAVETESLSEMFHTPNVPSFVVAPKPAPLPQVQPRPQPPQPQVKPKTKPPRAFASSCGHLVPIDPTKPSLLKLCGKG